MKSLIDDSVITCDENLDMLDTVSMNINDKNALCKMVHYILHTFL